MTWRVAPGLADRTALPFVVLLLVMLATAQSLVAQPAAAEPPMKVAIIDVQRLVTDSKVGKAALDVLRSLQEQKQAEADAMQQEIQDLRTRLIEGRLSLSEEKLEELQKNLEQKIIDYRRFQDDADRELKKGQEKAFADIERQVMPIIADLGREFGYTAIFNKYQSGLLYAKADADVTDVVLERFDQRAEQGN